MAKHYFEDAILGVFVFEYKPEIACDRVIDYLFPTWLSFISNYKRSAIDMRRPPPRRVF